MLMKGLIKVMSDDLFTENLMMRLWWMEKSRTYRMTERVLGQVEQSKALTLRWGHGGWKDKNLPVNRKADGEVRVSRRKKIGVEKKIKTMSSGNSFHVLMRRHWIHRNPTHPGGVKGKQTKRHENEQLMRRHWIHSNPTHLGGGKEKQTKNDMKMNSWCTNGKPSEVHAENSWVWYKNTKVYQPGKKL